MTDDLLQCVYMAVIMGRQWQQGLSIVCTTKAWTECIFIKISCN